METDLLNATLIERSDVGDGLSVVRLRPDNGGVPVFKPGQFVTLGLPRDDGEVVAAADAPSRSAKSKLIRRAYSIASSPDARDYIELLVVLVDEGRLTPKLWTVGQGGRLWMDEKIRGEFTMDDVPDGRDLVMISTGTGIAPYMSMMRTHIGKNRWRRLVMFNGVRLAADLGYRDELEDVARRDPSVIYVPMVTREPDDSDWTGLRGRVQTVLDDDELYQCLVGAPLDPNECHVFLCGNPEMIKSAEALLHDRGFTTHTRKQPGNIHFERYW